MNESHPRTVPEVGYAAEAGAPGDNALAPN